MTAIEVRGLTLGYGDQVVLQGLDFDVSLGEVFVILGGSGTGKSTLLKALVGLIPPMGGTIHMTGAGGSSTDAGPPAFGVMFQSGALFGSLTLTQNVALPLETWTDLDPEAVDTVVASKLRLVGLEGAGGRLPAELSGGMRRRAGIARALALDPALLFLDEPSAGLDPVTSVEIDELILTLNRSLGMTMVVVSHELPSIFTIASRCIMLDGEAKGIIARGDPRVLRDESDDPRVSSFFNRRSREV